MSFCTGPARMPIFLNNMRIFLIFHGRYPSEKAASLFAAKSAEAFADAGADLTLLVPKRMDRHQNDPYEFYGLRKNFETSYVSTLDLYNVPILGHLAHYVSYFVFSFSVVLYLLVHADRKETVYSNESLPLLFASIFFPNTIYELHDFPENKSWFYAQLLHRARRIIATNRWKAEELTRRFQVPPSKITVEQNAVDVGQFSLSLSKADARKRLELPQDRRIVVYTGHLYGWKGVETLAEAAKYARGALFYIVGGTEGAIESFRQKWGTEPNIRIVGHRPHDEMPLWQKAADVLVLPNTAKEEISARYTSPMKLFEYMASGTPIVASGLPSISEIVGGGRAILVAPDDPHALADGITRALHADGHAESENARSWVQDHTWGKRAARILKAIAQ